MTQSMPLRSVSVVAPMTMALLVLASSLVAADPPKPPATRFDLRDGDRVVLLGNTLIEREQKYGYWETMLTAHYPDRNITFRNLGWDGDTVWAESRGIFDPPAAGYARMIEQIKGLKPTVIFLGYGNNEAFAGDEGLDPFLKQYEKLLDDLTKVSAEGVRLVLILPMKHERVPAPLPDPNSLNESISKYETAIRKMADRRQIPTLLPVDFPYGRPENLQMTTDGIHLSEAGYRQSADQLATQYGALTRRFRFTAVLSLESTGKVVESTSYEAFRVSAAGNSLTFQAARSYLDGGDLLLFVRSLPEGTYTLKIDGRIVRTASADSWTEYAVDTIKMHPDQEQYEALRQAIVAKNELYFHSWRPQNVTYLFGFRKHEQGQNAKETAEFEKLVLEKEAEIAKLRKPVPHKYELVRESK